jgi:drug/metabolite transporter (DMT)-like permease
MILSKNVGILKIFNDVIRSLNFMNFENTRKMEHIADISILLIAIIWGSTFIIIKQAIDNVPTFAFLYLRFLTAAVILFLIAFVSKVEFNGRLVKDGLILGFTLFSVFAFQTFSLKYTSASITGFLTGLYVIFAPILSAIFLKKYPHIYSTIGVIFASGGMVFITLSDNINSFSYGELFGIINAFFIAVHLLLTDKFSREHSALSLTAIQIGVVGILSLIFHFLFETSVTVSIFNEKLIFALFITSILATVVAFFIQTMMQKYTTPTKAAIMFTMEPVSAAFFSYFIGGELLTFKQYFGAIMIIAAMIIAEVGTYYKNKNIEVEH